MGEKSKSPKRKFTERIPSIIGILVCIILAPMLVMNLTIIIKSYLRPNEVPDFLGIKPFIVLSGSMEPEILTGDVVIVKIKNPSELNVNDVIAFKEGNSVVTHRIIELTESDGEPAFITQGDANNTADTKPIIYSQVEGIYLYKIDGLGNVAMFMQTPMGLLAFVGAPLLLFIIYDAIRRRHENKKEDEKLIEARAEIQRLNAQLNKKDDN